MHSYSHTAKHGAYAYFPGTGPAGRRCGDCEHLIDSELRGGVDTAMPPRCRKWGELRQMKSPPRTWPVIEARTPACRYFVARTAEKCGGIPHAERLALGGAITTKRA
ncbi:MAG: hypothetical protein AB7P52_17640 [Alphaproteobacteria bacterium]